MNPCKACGGIAKEQTRSELSDVWLDEYNQDDYRITCDSCDNATPWNKKDAPGMPGVGVGYTKELWDKLNPI